MKTFPDYVMFCSSTGNQTVNLIPAIQFGIKKCCIVSTEFTEKEGLTGRLVDEMKQAQIVAEPISITKEEEKNPALLLERLLQTARNLGPIVWNISGGQKIPTIAFYDAFRKRGEAGKSNDVVLYMEATPPEIWYFGPNQVYEPVRIDASLSLSTILNLYGFEALKGVQVFPNLCEAEAKRVAVGQTALTYYLKDERFREAFFAFMMPSEEYTKTKKEIEELIRKTLSEFKPNVSSLHTTLSGYEDLEERIKTIFDDLEDVNEGFVPAKLIKPLKILMKRGQLYEDYWNSIKREAIAQILENMPLGRRKLIAKTLDYEEKRRLVSEIEAIGGAVTKTGSGDLFRSDILKFSHVDPNGILFEYMVVASVLDCLSRDINLRNAVSEVHMNVLTRKLAATSMKPDAELDLVIVTRFGTLLILEMKTHDFSGDVAKSKESSAYKKSGPYGKAMVIGPLTAGMVRSRADGRMEYPFYVDGKTGNQKATAEQNGVEYVYLDDLDQLLARKLFIRDAP